MGLLYLAAHIRRHFDAEFLVVNQREFNCGEDTLIRMARDFSPDVVGFSAFTVTSHTLPYLVSGIRDAVPGVLVLLGGPHVSAFQAAALDGTGADAAVPGEGELVFEEILRRHLDGSDFSDIPGLHWRGPDGETVTNPGRVPFIEDLDTLPFPAYDLIDVKKYWRIQSMPPLPRRKYISLTSSRGCPYHCTWCHRVFGDKFRAHSAARIADEVEHYVKAFGVDDVEFLDDIYNYSPRRVLESNDLMRRRGVRVKMAFPNGVRSDLLTEEVIDSMADAGTYWCSFALETASPRLQKLMGKNLNIPRFIKAVEMAAARRIMTNGFMMIGFPTETAEEMRLTVRTAAESRLHTASFFTVLPFPGTPIYEQTRILKPGLVERIRYDDIECSTALVNLSAEPDEVMFAVQREAWRQFYLRPSRVARIVRDYPQRRMLPYYLPLFWKRLTKDLFAKHGAAPAPPCAAETAPAVADTVGLSGPPVP